MTTPLHTIITQYLRTHGTMTVHDYMQLCLQHPDHGYYRKAQAVGKEGDFITAPEISQIFGDLLGMWMLHAWYVCGAPKKAVLVELGPGRGTLSADMLRMVKKNEDAAKVFQLHLVESNETLRAEQAKKLWKHQPIWHDTIESLPQNMPLFIIANEFFDALPIQQFTGDIERSIRLEDEQFIFTPEGEVTRETCPAAQEILITLAERLKKQGGVMLVVDYGYQGAGCRVQGADSLQALKNHTHHPVLQDAGEADLTAHVDFGALAETAKKSGLHIHGIATQGAFLERLGGEIWLKKLQAASLIDTQKAAELQHGWNRLTQPDQMGELFKVLAFTPEPCELAGLR